MLFLKNGAKNDDQSGSNDSIPQPNSNLPKIMSKKDFKWTPNANTVYPAIKINT